MQPVAPTLTLTLLQADPIWHAAEKNCQDFGKTIETTIARLKSPTDIIVLPEMFTTGFTMDVETQAQTMEGTTVQWMLHTAAQTNAVIMGSVIIEGRDQNCEGQNNNYFNRFICARPNGQLHYYDKRHLFRMAAEDQTFTAGKERTVVEINGWKIATMVCYDLRFPIWSRNDVGFEVLIYVANWPATRRHAWKSLLTARAIENQCYVVGVNRVGSDGAGLDYSGDSLVVDFAGTTLADLENANTTATVLLDLQALREFKQAFPFYRDADGFQINDIAK